MTEINQLAKILFAHPCTASEQTDVSERPKAMGMGERREWTMFQCCSDIVWQSRSGRSCRKRSARACAAYKEVAMHLQSLFQWSYWTWTGNWVGYAVRNIWLLNQRNSQQFFIFSRSVMHPYQQWLIYKASKWKWTNTLYWHQFEL